MTTNEGQVLYAVKRQELKEHLLARAEHYKQRNAKLVAEAEKIRDDLDKGVADMDTVTDRMHFKGSANYRNDSNRRDELFRESREVARRAARFAFLAEHLTPEFEFLICEEELLSLEML